MGLGSGRDSSESRFSTYVEALTGRLDMLTAQNVGRLSVGKLHQARAEKPPIRARHRRLRLLVAFQALATIRTSQLVIVNWFTKNG